MSEKKDRARVKPAGPTSVTDPYLADWIHALFIDGGKPPPSLKLQQAEKVRGQIALGLEVHTETIKPGSDWDIEKSGEISNKIVKLAQADCDRVTRRPQSYYVMAEDTSKSADSWRKYPLRMSPKLTYITETKGGPSNGAGGSGEEGEEGEAEAKSMLFRYLKEQIGILQWDKSQTNLMSGELHLLYHDMIGELRSFTTDLVGGLKSFMAEMVAMKRAEQDALNQANDRRVASLREEFKVEFWREGMRTGRNALQMFFGDAFAPPPPQPRLGSGEAAGGATTGGGAAPGGGGAGNGTAAPAPAPQVHPASEESTAVEDLFRDCEATGIFAKIFGEWSEKGLVKQGILLPNQCALLDGVRSRRLPPESIDYLIPLSGRPEAFRPDQVDAIQAAAPESVQMTVMRLMSIRKRKAEQASTPAPAPAQN